MFKKLFALLFKRKRTAKDDRLGDGAPKDREAADRDRLGDAAPPIEISQGASLPGGREHEEDGRASRKDLPVDRQSGGPAGASMERPTAKGPEITAYTKAIPPGGHTAGGVTVTVSRRAADMDAESQLAAFLDEHLYAPLLHEGGFVSIERVTDKALQLKGVDVIAKTDAQAARIDEKAQLYYINKDLPTFAFELQFLKGERVIEGWFLNDALLTDHYLLIWPFATVTDVRKLRKQDLTRLDALMISKKKLRNELATLGLTPKVLAAKADELRRTHTYDRTETGTRGIYYYASDPARYAEAPINLVISKERLIALADAHYEITAEGFTRVARG